MKSRGKSRGRSQVADFLLVFGFAARLYPVSRHFNGDRCENTGVQVGFCPEPKTMGAPEGGQIFGGFHECLLDCERLMSVLKFTLTDLAANCIDIFQAAALLRMTFIHLANLAAFLKWKFAVYFHSERLA